MSVVTPRARAWDVVFFLIRRRSSLLHAFTSLVQKYGTLFVVKTSSQNYFIVAEPSHLRRIMVTNAKNYSKKALHTRLGYVLGTGLFTSDGSFWRRQRALIQPAFGPSQLEGYAEVMKARSQILVERLRGFAETQEVFDIYPETVTFALDVVMETILGSEARKFHSQVHAAIATIIENIEHKSYARKVFEFMPWLAFFANESLKSDPSGPAIEALDKILYQIIAEKTPNSRDVLSILIKARDEERQGMSTVQLRDELMIAFIAGHETSAVALAWIFSLLAKHPTVGKRLTEEIQTVLKDDEITLSRLEGFPFAKAVLYESLRLYPPIWRVIRTAEEEDEIEGHKIPKGSTLVLIPYVTQHLAKFWPDPEEFRPERFLQEKEAVRELLSFLPFGAGPRVCIGQNFAINEMLFALLHVWRDLDLELAPACNFAIDPRLSLRPKGPLAVRAKLKVRPVS